MKFKKVLKAFEEGRTIYRTSLDVPINREDYCTIMGESILADDWEIKPKTKWVRLFDRDGAPEVTNYKDKKEDLLSPRIYPWIGDPIEVEIPD